MRILLIAQFGRYGGTREAFKRVLNIHQKNGFETHVMICHDCDENIKEYIRKHGASFTEMTKRGRLFTNMIGSVLYDHLNYKSILKNWKPDLIVTSIGTSQLALYPFTRQYPMVYMLHTIPLELNSHIRMFFKIFSFLSGKNQLICGVSEATVKSVVRNWGYDNDKTAVLHNTFNEENINNGSSEAIENSKISVLTLGHVVWYKNPEVWLDVAKKITAKYNQVEFIWLGDGALFNTFKEKTANEPRIKFLGFRRDVRSFYSKASIYFQPSITENHSYSVLDAMANSLPCVVSNVGGQPESIREGIDGYLCEADDSEAFIRKLVMLIQDSELRKRLGQQAKHHAFKDFHPHKYEEKLLNIYNKALNM